MTERTLHGKAVVVTGASAGVGRATALEFARGGARVALLARGHDGLEAAQREITALGAQALVIVVDIADASAVDAAASRVEAELGAIEVWVNCAMVTIFSPVHRILPDEFRRATEVTYLGTVYGSQAAIARMRGRGRGVIVQVGSALSYRAIPLQSAYCGAKFAIRGFTDALRVEQMHERTGIHITMVQLSAFNTPQFDWALSRMPRRAQPVPPIFQPEVAARAIVWAATHRRREVVVGWPALKAIWGNKLLPQLADRLLTRQGYQGQLTDEPESPQRPCNLYHPLLGDHGSHGRFDARARATSRQLWMTMHRTSLAAAVLLLFIVVLLLCLL